MNAAEDLLEDHLTGARELIAPATLPVELANALRYSPMQLATVVEITSEFDLAHIGLFSCTSARLSSAVGLAFEHGITVYDALFLALAIERECPLLTADRKAFGNLTSLTEIRIL